MEHNIEVVHDFCKKFHDSKITLTAIKTTRNKKGYYEIATETFNTAKKSPIKAFLLIHPRESLYFSVNEIDTKKNKARTRAHYEENGWTLYRDKERKAKKIDVIKMHWLHIDIDVGEEKNKKWSKTAKVGYKDWFTHTPLTEEEFDNQRTVIQNRIAEFKVKPTLTIDSGNGFQCFWKLDPPRIIEGANDTEILKDCSFLERYNYQLGQDLKGDNCFNIERVMRLPGSVNFPNEEKLKKGRKERQTLFTMNDLTYTFKPFNQAELGTVMPERQIKSLPELITIPIPGSFYQMLEFSDSLLARWQGSTQGLEHDKSRSSMDLSLVSILKELEFTTEQTFAILKEFKHGKLNQVQKPQPYFERMWSRANSVREWMIMGSVADDDL